jgi:hypothetical protein
LTASHSSIGPSTTSMTSIPAERRSSSSCTVSAVSAMTALISPYRTPPTLGSPSLGPLGIGSQPGEHKVVVDVSARTIRS